MDVLSLVVHRLGKEGGINAAAHERGNRPMKIFNHGVVTDTAIYIIQHDDIGGKKIEKIPYECSINHISDFLELASQPFYDLQALWVMPGSELSGRATRAFVEAPTASYTVQPSYNTVEVNRPACVLLRRKNTGKYEKTVYVQFPEWGEWRVDGVNDNKWITPDAKALLVTVFYLNQELGTDIIWGAANIGHTMIRASNASRMEWLKVPKAYVPSEVLRDMTLDLLWHRPTTLGERGMSHFVVYDKNAQYPGAASSKLPVGDFQHVGPESYDPKKIGVWSYNVTPQSFTESVFNGSDLPYPLAINKQWTTTDIIEAARKHGVDVEIEEGYQWDEARPVLEKWVGWMWGVRAALKSNVGEYPYEVARENAYASIKKMMNAPLGRFARDFAGDLYRPEWLKIIISRARATQIYSLEKYRKLGYTPAMVYKDAYYFFVDSPAGVPGMLDKQYQLAGYKQVAMLPVTPELIAAFDKDTTFACHRAVSLCMKGDK